MKTKSKMVFMPIGGQFRHDLWYHLIVSKKRSVGGSFTYAWDGIKEAFQNEPNFRFHLSAAILTIIAGLIFSINSTEWTIVLLTIVGVVTLELLNTAVESLVDLVSPKFHKLAKIAKDVSAAAVLISSIGAVLIGILIFYPRILEFLNQLK